MRCLVWFRSDLRVGDNAALAAACRAGRGGVVGLFVISPGQWRQHDYAPVKVDFILRTLRVLSESLARLNIPLVIAHAPTLRDVPRVVLDAARTHACDAVYLNREYEIDERRRDESAQTLIEEDGRRCYAFTDQVLVEPGEVRTGEGRFFTVFSPFKRALYAHMLRHGMPAVYSVPGRQQPLGIEPTPVPSHVEGFTSSVRAEIWPAGEAEALRRLDRFIAAAGDDYKARRDFPGDDDGTSRLSPYLAVGAISPRQCVAAAVQANVRAKPSSPFDTGSEGLSHWISEVAWREFYVHILIGFPRVCMGRAFQPSTEAIVWNDNEAHFRAWCEGRTGVPIVDASMRQLRTLGWMHNRLRMVAAMYLTKNLFIDWRRGEKFFMQHLVDGFLASNNGGWQWSASTGTDAAPYFRIFNPVSQSQKFDPEGHFIRRMVPELSGVAGDAIHEPWEMPLLLRTRLEYPMPLVDLSTSRQAAIEAFQRLKGS